MYYKLRFRRAGKQHVRYIGGSVRAQEVSLELSQLQAELRLIRRLARLLPLARQLLRDAKKSTAPLVAAAGWKYHGQAIRRPRNQSSFSS